MSDEGEFSLSVLRRRRQEINQRLGNDERGGARGRMGGPGFFGEGEQREGGGGSIPFDPLRLLDGLLRRWYWLFLLAGLFAAAGTFYGVWSADYWAEVRLIRRETPTIFNAGLEGESYKPKEFTAQTLVSLMQSPELLRKVSAKSKPPVPVEDLEDRVEVRQERATDIVVVRMGGKDPSRLVGLINTYAEEAVALTRDIQARQSSEVNRYLQEKVREVEGELSSINKELLSFTRANEIIDLEKEMSSYLDKRGELDMQYENAKIDLATLDFRMQQLARQNPQLIAERQKLEQLRLNYTDQHPAVKEQRKKVEMLEQQAGRLARELQEQKGAESEDTSHLLSLAGRSQQLADLKVEKEALKRRLQELEKLKTRVQKRLEGLSEKSRSYAEIKAQVQSLEISRDLLASRQREAQLFEDNALGYYQLFEAAKLGHLESFNRWKKGLLFGLLGGLVGMILSGFFVLLVELVDPRIKTASDLGRVTGLPVLASLGNMNRMSPADLDQWAFRTWTMIKGKLHISPNRGMVCGFISSHASEGRSVWINLLAEAAQRRGFRVLTISSQQEERMGESKVAEEQNQEPLEEEMPEPEPVLAHGGEESALMRSRGNRRSTAIAASAWSFPAQVTEKLNSPEPQPIVKIPLPGWVWNLERRKEWKSALAEWSRIDNLVILVELPPASVAEGVLLGENLPQLIWLSGSGRVTNAQVRSHLELLRYAGCDLVGSVLNFAPTPIYKRMFPRAFALMTAVLAMGVGPLHAQSGLESVGPEEPDPTERPAMVSTVTNEPIFTIAGPEQRAEWQKELTVGPGDVLNFSIYGKPDLSRSGIFIRPDGRVSYLQAQDVMASGLTIAELRQKFDEILSEYYLAPRTIIIPVEYNSKKYYLLGNVANKGVFALDQPTTIVEAVARANGFVATQVNRKTMEVADLSRSFLVRERRRVPVDFERLFLEGDLTQNIPLEPNDYLYFPPMDLREVYVLGEVLGPGVLQYNEEVTVLRAITMRGGFTPRAWKKKVLVVRGSLLRPDTFTVDAQAILDAREKDFALKPKDIIYVHDKPWSKITELLDLATRAFINSAVVSWTGQNVGPIIDEPIIE